MSTFYIIYVLKKVWAVWVGKNFKVRLQFALYMVKNNLLH